MPPPSVFKADLSADGKSYSRYERVYLLLATGFVTVLVLTNIIGIKLFQAPHDPSFALTTGIITYPLTFLFTDIVSEVYGKKRADFMVLIGFLMSLIMLVIVQVAVAVPASPVWVPGGEANCVEPIGFYCTVADYQHAYESVFSLGPLLVFGSMTAYLCAQLTDNYLFHFWKRKTRGRHLWLRNNASTWVSQLVDTLIVNSILFFIGFKMDLAVGLKIMATIYVYKLIIAAIDTPFIYLGVFLVRNVLGISSPSGESEPRSTNESSQGSEVSGWNDPLRRQQRKMKLLSRRQGRANRRLRGLFRAGADRSGPLDGDSQP
ncbi:MAG: queuosine precursor transporter [Myxococcota bacterium]|nr:queuosine precursor transporter [Myxococcota bacterium]